MTASVPGVKDGMKLGVSQVVSQVSSFLRNVIIARLISPEDFGIATTFALTFFFVEMIGNVAAQTLMVQADYGNDTGFQDTAHALQAIRGLANSLLIAFLAGPLSLLFGVPQAAWAFQCLALVPLVKGVAHTDPVRLQRESKFGLAIRVDVWTNVLTVFAACALGVWLRNYWVMVCVLLIQVTCLTVGSHLVAERPYRWTWDRNYIAHMLTFGWPLLINGLLLYLILQGDRVVIGAAHQVFPHAPYSLADLAVYSIAFSLTLSPSMLAGNVSTSLFLPVLSRVRSAQSQFERCYLVCVQVVSLAAAGIAVPIILVGGWLVVLIYGTNYASTESFIGWLAATQALRIIRMAPTLAAMALGDTKNAMVSNVVRAMGFMGVLAVAAAGWKLDWIAICGFISEVGALMVCLWRLRRAHGIAIPICLKPCAIIAMGMGAAAAAKSAGVFMYGWSIALVTSGLLVGAVFSVMLFAYPDLRRDLRVLVARSGSR